MNMRERMLAVVQGTAHDRVPFAQCSGLSGSDEEIWSVIGRENMGIMRWLYPYRVETPGCSCHDERIECNGLRGTRTVMHTPEGQLTQERFYEPALGSGSIRKHFVKEPADYRALMAYFRSMKIYPDATQLDQTLADLGDDGIPHVTVDRTPYQQLWIQWVSLEDLCLHMADFPELLEECIDLMSRNLRQLFKAVCSLNIPYVVFPDNITAPTIGERYFTRYCVPYYQELADMLSDRDIPVYVHMDGDLKPLWNAIAVSKVRGLDSFSPPPDNDTSTAEAVSLWPEMRLGLNFPSSIHLDSSEAIYDMAARIIRQAEGSGRLQIQISENVPPGLWRKSFPAIVSAINDFGRY